MSKSTAVLIDGGFLLRQLKQASKDKTHATAADIYNFANKTLASDEELFRMYYYDCPPYEGTQTNPISNSTHDYATAPYTRARKAMLSNLTLRDHVAFRKGQLSFDGWQIDDGVARELMKEAKDGTPARHLESADIFPKFSQKRVDMNIGLDVAWLSSKRIVHRIILVTADSDFIPAMKFARREGVQIVLVPLRGTPKKELLEHADIVRSVTFP